MRRVLFELLWLETRGQAQLLARRLATPRGAAMALTLMVAAGALILSLSLTPARGIGISVGGEGFRSWGPLGLLGFVAMGAFSPRGLYFRPPEVALLFPAPLHRHELVLFNVLARARVAVLSALWLALLPSLRATGFFTAFLGYLLIMLLMQTSGQWFAVVRLWLSQRRGARYGLWASLGVVVAGAWSLGALPVLVEVLTWLTRPFIQVLTAPSAGEAVQWAVVSAVIVLALVASLCGLDVAYQEAALARSDQVEARKAGIRSGGGNVAGTRRGSRLRVPPLPRMGGAGPIAWRHCIELVRNPRGILLVLAVVATSAAMALSVRYLQSTPLQLPEVVIAWIAVGVVFMASLLTGDNLAFDFRRDLDRLPYLKSVPVRPGAIASGQILAATSFATAVQLLGMAGIALATGNLSPGAMAAVALVLPPANWAVLAVENTLFLLMPYRMVPDDPGDVGFVGRMMLVMTVKVATLLLLGGVALGAGRLAYLASGGSVSLAAVSLAAILVAACAPLTRLLAWAFQRFDVARDLPA